MALALVLVFRSTHLVNFAQGEMAAVGLFLAVDILVIAHLPLVVGLLIGLAVTSALGVMFGLFAERMVKRGRELAVLVSSFGLMIAINALIVARWAPNQPYRMSWIPAIADFNVGGAQVPGTYLSVFIVATVVCGSLAAAMRLTNVGLQVRAMVESIAVAELIGVPTRRLRLLVWLAGTGLAMLAGALYSSTNLLDASQMGLLTIKGFAAASIGGFESFTAAVVGAILLGVLEQVLGRYVAGGFGDMIAVVVVVAVLLVVPKGLFATAVGR
jgi:branched-chain amino acid transport system permease protein